MLSKRKSIGDYTIGKTIGQGAFSKVKIAFNKVTKEEVNYINFLYFNALIYIYILIFFFK